MRVLILHDAVRQGARPDELDTLVQVRAVGEALRALDLESKALAFGADLEAVASSIRAEAPDLVFNLVESVAGEERLIHVAPALLEALGVPFTGAPLEAMFHTASKLLAHRVLAAAGLPIPPRRTQEELRNGAEIEPARWVLKAVWEHGSVGLEADSVRSCANAAELLTALEDRAEETGKEVFAEGYVHGREFNVSLLAGPFGTECLPIPEMLFRGLAPDEPRIVGYRAKWEKDSAEWNGTQRCFALGSGDEALHARLRDLALAAWQAFGLDGAARVDFRVDSSGRAFVIDVNANPCLSPDAGFAAAIEQARIHYPEAIHRIVQAALRRGPPVPSLCARGERG
jgi:D-alanine-D-alanine ligase